MAQLTQTRMAASEFLELPETMTHTELIQGEIIVSPAPELEHQRLIFELGKLVERKAEIGTVWLSPVDVHLDDRNVVQPDVLWLAPDSQCKSIDGKYLSGAPDLVIEVFSPRTARQDRGVKFTLYETYGVKEYWMVDPVAQFIEVWTRGAEKFERLGIYGPEDTFHSPLLDKDVELKGLFAE